MLRIFTIIFILLISIPHRVDSGSTVKLWSEPMVLNKIELIKKPINNNIEQMLIVDKN